MELTQIEQQEIAKKLTSFSDKQRHKLIELITKEGIDILKLPIVPAIKKSNNISLSWAQERLWFLNQLEGKSVTTYNMPAAIRISSNLDINILQKALSEIVQRHESLRTSFHTENDKPIQIINPEAKININLLDLRQLEITERETLVTEQAKLEATTPFDLENAPLIRCNLLQLSVSEYVLLITMHHIISDGWSMGILIQELFSLYQAFIQGKSSPLAQLPIQYADFAVWQKQYLSGEVLSTQLDYWKQQLSGIPDLLQLPTDFPRPNVKTYQGRTISFNINTDLTNKLQTFSRESGTTLFMTLYAAFTTLLYRYSGQSDIVVGSPIANRNRNEIEGLIGFFANTLVLRTQFENNPSFKDLLKQVSATTLKAYENQDVPFEQVVEALQPQRSLNYSPLFQVMFVLQNTPMNTLELSGMSLQPLSSQAQTAKFDLAVSVEQTSKELMVSWEYSTELFHGSTIGRMAAHYQNLLEAILSNPQLHVNEIPLFTDSELNELLLISKNITTNYQLYQYTYLSNSSYLPIYILDEKQQLVPLGVEGEIYLSNWDTYSKNIDSDVTIIKHPQVDKLFRTGEWGRRQGNGSLELLGKTHRIVKVKGQRINLQLIEKALLTVVEDCYVVLRNQELVAYIVKQGHLSSELLNNHLKSELPGYPIPYKYISVSA